MIKTHGLTHIHLLVKDLDRSLNFYQKVFGMVETQRHGTLVFLNTPGTEDMITLHLAKNDKGEIGKSGGIEHFGFSLKDQSQMDQAIEEVIQHGGKLINKGQHAPGYPFAYVSDPDGYTIEL